MRIHLLEKAWDVIYDFRIRYGLIKHVKNRDFSFKTFNLYLNGYKWIFRILIIILLFNCSSWFVNSYLQIGIYFIGSVLLLGVADYVILLDKEHIIIQKKILGLFNRNKKYLFSDIDWIGFKNTFEYKPVSKKDYFEKKEELFKTAAKYAFFTIKLKTGRSVRFIDKKNALLSLINRIETYQA